MTEQDRDYILDTLKDLAGKRVKCVRALSTAEVDALMWSTADILPIVIEFTDGAYIIPMRDNEGNGAGALCYADSSGYIHS